MKNLSVVGAIHLASLTLAYPAQAPAAGANPAQEGEGVLSRALTFDGQLRLRYELADPFSYSLGTPAARAGTDLSDDFVAMRTRLGAEFRPDPRVGLRAVIQDSRLWGEEGAANTTANSLTTVGSATDNLDLHEGYLELNQLFARRAGDGALTMRLGRQELSYGDQRLVSPLDWANVARAWDAARLIWMPPGGAKGLRIDVFGSVIRDTASSATGGPVLTADTGISGSGVDQIDDKQEFHGIYATYGFQPLPDWKHKGWQASEVTPILRRHSVDIYGFYRRLADDNLFFSEDGSEGIVKEFTTGMLLKGGALGFDYSGEGVYQGGRYAGDAINAFGVAVTAGYNVPPPLLDGAELRAGVEYDYGSGDSDPTDGKRETFDPIYPFAHNFHGSADLFSWKNGQDLMVKGTVELPRWEDVNPIWFEAQYHWFWLAGERDGWFNAGLGQIRRDPAGDSGRFVGNELDLHLKYTLVDLSAPVAAAPGRHRVWIWLGYTRFFPGEFVEETGDSPDRDFVYAQVQVDL